MSAYICYVMSKNFAKTTDLNFVTFLLCSLIYKVTFDEKYICNTKFDEKYIRNTKFDDEYIYNTTFNEKYICNTKSDEIYFLTQTSMSFIYGNLCNTLKNNNKLHL